MPERNTVNEAVPKLLLMLLLQISCHIAMWLKMCDGRGSIPATTSSLTTLCPAMLWAVALSMGSVPATISSTTLSPATLWSVALGRGIISIQLRTTSTFRTLS